MEDEVSERLARILDRTGDYRVLRRVPTPPPSAMTDADRAAAGLVTGIVLDTETTGLGAEDEVIELGMLRFAADSDEAVTPPVCRLTALTRFSVCSGVVG